MPIPKDLEPLEITFERGYFPSASAIPHAEFLGTIRAGSNVWIRPTGKPEVANGLLQTSSQNVGARIFAANTQRATFADALVGSRLPYAGLIRHDNAALIYVSEAANAQLYLDEFAVSGVTTSPTAGRLRVAIPNGGGGYDDFDAGFDKPLLTAADVSVNTADPGVLGNRPMAGLIGVALAPWRITTDAIGPPSDIIYSNVPAQGSAVITLGLASGLPSHPAGQDGWIYCGTRWDDRSGEIRVVRYIRLQPRGTFTGTLGSPNLTAPVGTFWIQDLREHDLINISGNTYEIATGGVTPTQITLTTNFLSATNSGYAIIIRSAAANWYDAELGALVSQDTAAPPLCAGVLKYAGRVFIWGVGDKSAATAVNPTGNVLVPMLPFNPEHCDLTQAIGSDSGSDILNALGGDGPIYLMTMTSLEVISFTSDPTEPYKIKTIAQPGFKAGTNGVLEGDYFYGFNGMPFRTQASENLDFEFATAVREVMKTWDAAGVKLAVDPINKAVLFIYDNGSTTVVLPFMTQHGVWGPELNFSARIIDTQVVDGALYVTYLSGGNYRVNEWEGGAGIGGTRYVASQYYDPRLLARNRVKRLAFVGKAGTLRVYAVPPGGAVPDVTNTSAATASFTLSDTDIAEPEIGTNIGGKALAFRIDFPSNDGKCDKLVAAGTPIGERR